MPRTPVNLFVAVLLLGVLAGCESTSLIRINKEFVDLMRSESEADQALERGELDRVNHAAALEGIRQAFADNGERAVKAAEDSEDPGDKASFLNAATRSLLKSGPLGDRKIPDLALQGVDVCSTDDFAGVKALPTTCGYFHIVPAQAINNEWERERLKLRRAADVALQQGSFLDGEQGRDIVRTFGGYMTALEALEAGERKIDWDSADEALRSFFFRQQNLIFCNARDARTLVLQVVESAEDWDRNAANEDMGRAQADWQEKLRNRSVGFNASEACRTR